uniref:Uncharacterized protein n=2 Tax=Oryza sativa subsp. japonica TaxID=39947 RepID=Q2RB76_ORYSJ|nr:hypothetical protein LOC_Os11g02940 [Oryza sativa Japonica Group]
MAAMGIGGGGEQIGAEGGGGDLATKGIPVAGSVAARSSSAWKVSAAGIDGGEEQLGVEGVGGRDRWRRGAARRGRRRQRPRDEKASGGRGGGADLGKDSGRGRTKNEALRGCEG